MASSYKKDTIIFDLDGTLANIEERRKLANKNGKFSWKEFFNPDNIQLDEPNWPVIQTFHAMKSVGYRVIIFSGRSDITMDATMEWLKLYDIEPDFMIMRPHSNYTKDSELKKHWLDNLKSVGVYKENILCVYDDRDQVVKMWRENNIPCFQVNYGDF